MKLIYCIQLSIIFIILFNNNTVAIEKNRYEYEEILNIIEIVKTGDKNKIATIIKYPLKRRHPVPSIKDEQMMVKRFDEIFDEFLLNAIKNSNIRSDWSEVGWRGVHLDAGLWVDGGKIYAVNHRTDLEIKIANDIILEQKRTLHPSIKDFINPVLEWNTENYHIRVDRMDTNSFRYTSWKRGVPTSKKPDLVLLNGIVEYQGTDGGHRYVFKNDIYKYLITVIYSGGSDYVPGELQVIKGDDIILTEVWLGDD